MNDVTARIRTLVRQFDGDFDSRGKAHIAIGELIQLEAGEDPENAPDAYLGTAWCRLVRADVDYDLSEGHRLIAKTRGVADVFDPKDDFGKYVLARWRDGTGRLQYRMGSHTDGRLQFAAAVDLVQDKALWTCRPDVTSNYLRSLYEERRQVGTAAAAATEMIVQFEQAIAAAARHPSTCASNWEIREYNRGVCNLHHNLSEMLRAMLRWEDALTEAGTALKLAQELADPYRIAQALNLQAMAYLVGAKLSKDTRQRGLWQEAQRRFVQMRNPATCRWPRGEFIARQNIANLESLFGRHEVAAEQIVQLLDLLDRRREYMGDDTGQDLDLHFFTVASLESILTKTAHNAEWRGKAETRLRQARLDVVRSLRRVVKVHGYKVAFAKFVEPTYLHLIAEALEGVSGAIQLEVPADPPDESRHRDAVDRMIAIIEESSARELLDVMSVSAEATGAMTPTVSVPAVPWTLVADKDNPSSIQGMRRGVVRDLADPTEEVRLLLDTRRRFFETEALSRPIESTPHDSEVGFRARMFTASEPGWVILRFFRVGSNNDERYGAVVIREGHSTKVMLPEDAGSALTHLRNRLGTSSNGLPTPDDAKLLSAKLLEPLWSLVQQPTPPKRLLLVPTGVLFDLPIHIAFEPNTSWPLAATQPLCFSVSLGAFVSRGRNLLARQPTEMDDDLCALLCLDDRASGKELLPAQHNWNPEHFLVAGKLPEGSRQTSGGNHFRADWSGLQRLVDKKPEFFVYAGHGIAHPLLGVLSERPGQNIQTSTASGAALKLDGDILTQFDVAMRLRLPRNRLTILGACVSGAGAASVGGEVAGFIRAFIAAGGGAIATTLWSVLDDEIVHVAGRVLGKVADAVRVRGQLEPVDLFHEAHQWRCRVAERVDQRIDGCPFVIYL